MKKRNLILFLFSIFIFSNAQEIKKIVSLAPSLTKMIYLLDAKERVSGCTNYCIAKNDNVPVVGSAVETNIEKILLINPDVIIVTSLTKPETINILKKVGLNVKEYPLPKNFLEICDQFIDLGELIGKKELAIKIVKEQKVRLAELTSEIDPGIYPRIFLQIGANPTFAAVPGSFMNDYIVQLKGFNIAHDVEVGIISTEIVLLRDPEVIIIVTMGQTGSDEKKKWENYPDLAAVKNKKIFLVNPDKSCSPTPVEYIDTLEELINLIY